MKCSHCCYSCSEQGEDMSLRTFKKAVLEDSETVIIGGGEPTVHPQFWEFLGWALGHSEFIWLATNGKLTETAISLAELAKKGVIACSLSLDKYHEKINPIVVKAFTKKFKPGSYVTFFNNKDLREIRNVDNNQALRKVGRSKKGFVGCVCDDIMVKPNGSMQACGCPDSPVLGNILTGYTIPDKWKYSECWKNQNKEIIKLLKNYNKGE